MPIRRTAFNFAMRLLKQGLRLLGKRREALISAHLVEHLSPVVTIETKMGRLKFYCPGAIPLWRAATLSTKEPETIEWIDTFKQGDIFWDIGANVGIYSLYAALKPDVCVLAFEPAVVNCYALNRNIEINRLDGMVTSFCLAFSNTTCLDHLYMESTKIGGALHGFAEAVDWQGKAFKASFKQGTLGYSIDDFVEQFDPPFPNHIKIDVDGIEEKIIEGAKRTISDNRLRSLLVELDSNRTDKCGNVIELLESARMRLYAKKHGPMVDTGQFSSIYNYIFVRS